MAKGLRAQLAGMFGRAVSAGSKAVIRELERDRKSTRKRAAPKPKAPARAASDGPKPLPPGANSSSARSSRRGEPETGGYRGDFNGKATLQYAPLDDGRPDPGEVVWAWVPFEEDHSQGKDRPVLVIARHRDVLLGLMLTSKDHDRDQDQEARQGRYWLDIGTGDWDREGRPSEVRLDRILQLDPGAVRREGAALDREAYDRVAVGVRRTQNW